MANHLTKITTKAKQLYKTGRYKKWTDAVKAASKQVKATPAKRKKVGATPGAKKYKAIPRKYKVEGDLVPRVKPAKKSARSPLTRISPAQLNGVSLRTPKAQLMASAKDQLGKLYVQRDMATTKRDKKAIGKKITATKARLRLVAKL